MNYLSFYLPGNALISSFLKDSLLDIEFLVCSHFLLALRLCHSHRFLTFIVSEEKPAVNLVEETLHVMSHFSLAVFKILSFGSSSMTYPGVDPTEFILRVH